ncbi:hypothetical protein CSQ89_03450 [Chitinimonas sp. BJB300]|nr:hypothetical protein CSQ89_03450 [Chitinimonas sp. BJB300]
MSAPPQRDADQAAKRSKRNTVVVTDTFSRTFHQTRRATFASIHKEAQQDSRTTRILIKALQQSGRMSVDAANRINFFTKLFLEGIAKDYAQFADEMTLNKFMQSRLAREMDGVADFLNNKNLINRWISARPNETDTDLINYTVSFLNGTIEREVLPINSSEPFVSYLDKLYQDLNWIDWGQANKKIITPTQAIHALHVHADNFGLDKLDGLALGERLAKGDRVVTATAWMSPLAKERLDKAAILFCLAREPNLGLVEAPRHSMPLGEQLTNIRRAFLYKLREEWQLSQMFLPNADRSNVFVDHNALVNTQGKTFSELVNDPVINSIPGMSTLDLQVRESLVRRKLDRMGESTEYRFGTLQHGMVTILKRSLLVQGDTVPDSFGPEAQMVGQFLALCGRWEAKQSVMLNPKMLLAQYLAQASGENITVGLTTTQQKIAALEIYLGERWLANYGEPPQRFDRNAALLKLIKAASQNPATRDERLYSNVGGRHFRGAVIGSREQFQQAEDAYNQALTSNAWIHARAKENIRESGRELNAGNMQTEREAIIARFHAQTETERENNDLLRIIRGIPLIGNVWRFGEGIYNGNAEEIIGAIPIAGNVYELEEGIRHGDAGRAVSAIPIIGSGYQFEEALRKGDGIDIVMTGAAFIFDVATLGEVRTGAARSGLNMAEHMALKEAELPTAHAIGLRNYLSLRKALDIPLKTEHIESTVGNFEHNNAGISLGDPYGIESFITRHDLPPVVEVPVPSIMAFGEEMDKYQVAAPSSEILVNESGIFESENNRYIKSGDKYYPVRYDADNGTWRVFYPDNPTKPAIPVRYQDGIWQIHSDVGLKGGGGLLRGRVLQPAVSGLEGLFNDEMKDVDHYLVKRKESFDNYYELLKFSKKPYEGSFDVEGHIAGHQKMAETHPGTGKTYFDIRTHSDSNKALSITGKAVGPREFANEIKKYVKYYKPGTPIRLLACEAGRGGVFSFAQRFANAMNVPVKAYTVEVNLLSSMAALEKYAKVFEPS